jgi:predicted DCC family thiol-disulfide oxidoreductase YuxK
MRTSVDPSGSLLYDEDCGICVATATWLATRVAPSRLGLLALGDVEDDPRIAALVQGRPLTATLHFVRSDDTILTGARAVLAAGRVVPRWRFLAALFDHRIGHMLLEPVYRQIAAHRRQIGRALGLPAACPLPRRRQESS